MEVQMDIFDEENTEESDRSMDVQIPEVETYTSSGLKTSLHGTVYQLLLLMWYVVKLKDKEYDSKIATEMTKAEKLDDIVVKYYCKNKNTWNYIFLQAKHNIKNDPITTTMFMNVSDGDFCLLKYFISFCKIKENDEFVDGQLTDIIICTNRGLSMKRKQNENDQVSLFKKTSLPDDHILQYDDDVGGSVCETYQIKKSAVERLKTHFATCKSTRSAKSAKITREYKKIITRLKKQKKLDQLLNEFIDKLILVTKYPDVNGMNALLCYELEEEYKLLDVDLLTSSFQAEMLKWFREYNEGESSWLSKDNYIVFFEGIKLKLNNLMLAGLSHAYKDANSNVHFMNRGELSGFLQQNDQQVLCVKSLSPRLSTMKLLDELEKNDNFKYNDSYICVRFTSLLTLKTEECIESTLRNKSDNRLVIFECQQGILKKHSPKINSLCQMCQKNNKLILVLHETEVLTKKLKQISTSINDKTHFKDLTAESKSFLLKTQVNLQNSILALDQLMDRQTADQIIDEVTLENLLSVESIKLGDDKVLSSMGYDQRYYTRRFLTPQKVQTSILTMNNVTFMISDATDEVHSFCGSKTILKHVSQMKNAIFLLNGEQSFDELVKYGHPVVWLRYDQNNLFWLHSANIHGTMDFVDYLQDSEAAPLYGEDFFTRNLSKRVFILANEAGAGKSTILTSLARNIRSNDENSRTWIINVELNLFSFKRKHLTEGDGRMFLKNLDEIPEDFNEEVAIETLINMVVPSRAMDFRIQSHLLEHGIRYGTKLKVVVFFDGYDEIDAQHKKKIEKLFKALRRTALLQMWKTTRVHERSHLQKCFQCPAYVLKNFNHEEQVKFLNNFWKKCVYDKLHTSDLQQLQMHLLECETQIKRKIPSFQLSKPNEEQDVEYIDFSDFSEYLTLEWNKSVSSKEKSFLDIPLQLKMLGELVFVKKFDVAENMNLTNLFNSFMDYKLQVVSDKYRIDDGNAFEQERGSTHEVVLNNVHRLSAMKTLIPDSDFNYNDILNDLLNAFPIGEEAVYRIGLIVDDFYNNPEWVHRSFAEFFLAKFINDKLHNDKIQKLLLVKIIMEQEYSLTLVFLENFIENDKIAAVMLGEETRQAIEIIANEESPADTFVHRLAQLGYTETLRFFISKL